MDSPPPGIEPLRSIHGLSGSVMLLTIPAPTTDATAIAASEEIGDPGMLLP